MPARSAPALLTALGLLTAAAGSATGVAVGIAMGAAPASAGETPGVAPAQAACTPLASRPVRAGTLDRRERAAVREVNDLTAAELTEVTGDPHGWVDRCGAVFFTEPVHAATRSDHDHGAGTHASAHASDTTGPVPDDVLSLSSRPGSTRTIYLDFTGDTTTGTQWNHSYAATTISSPPYSINAPATAAFDAAERAAVHLAWRTVAEDFAPFDVNVTTLEPSPDAITRTSLADPTYGTRVVITSSNEVGAGCGCGGVAYLNVFDKVGMQQYQPAWVFTAGTGTNGYDLAQAASHEAGHNFGLAHDGTLATPTAPARSYYSGVKGWAPLMGASYGRRLAQWSNGRYPGADNTQDDVAVIARSAPVVVDDHAAGPVGATSLVPDVPVAGLVGSRTDVDAFAFRASGTTQLAVTGPSGVGDLDVALTVLDGTGTPVALLNPTSDTAQDASLNATWTATLPDAPAAYTALVDGTGFGNPAEAGRYDDYGSLGTYQVVLRTAGSTVLPPAEPDPLPEPDLPSEPDPSPTAAPDPVPSTPGTTTAPPTEVRSAPAFLTRRLAGATWQARYRGVVRFSGPTESVRLRGLPRGLTWKLRKGRILIRGNAERRGRFGVRVVLLGPDAAVRRTFRLRVR